MKSVFIYRNLVLGIHKYEGGFYCANLLTYSFWKSKRTYDPLNQIL
jgi:hypothetical protein